MNTVDDVTLTKGKYDSMRETHTRVNLFLQEILNMSNIELSEDRNSIVFSQEALNNSLRILFNDTYKKKLTALRTQDTRRTNGN